MTMFMQIIFKLFLGLILGGLVGYEREHRSSPAGLRTHILVCIGSVLVQITAFDFYLQHQSIDPMRLGAQVISGIGFLGAGTIIKEGASIKGLTTAASIWSVACIGLAVGTGLYVEAVTATIFIYISLELLKRFEKKIAISKKDMKIDITMENIPGKLESIVSQFNFLGINAVSYSLINREENKSRYMLHIQIPIDIPEEKIAEKLFLSDGVIEVKFE